MKTRCMVIDDEELARTLLKTYILKVPELELTGSYKNPLEAIQLLNVNQVELVFLDIQMPELTGIEFLRLLNRSKPCIVFTTAYPQYAVEGFDLDVVDYLVKPFSFERFLHSVQKVSQMIGLSKENSAINENFLVINSGHKTYKLLLDEILYIEGLREYVSYYTTDNKRIISLESLKDIEKNLSSKNFVRVHKSYIVNGSKIKVIESNTVWVGNKDIPMGSIYKDGAVKKLLS